MNEKHLPDEQRAEYRDFVDEMAAHYRIHQPSGRDMGALLRNQLESIPSSWALRVLEDAQIDGLWSTFKNAMKAESVALVSHDGQVIAKATRVGTKRRNDDGTEGWQQSLLHDMSWSQVEQWLDQTIRQIGALFVNRGMAERLLDLRDQFPDSVGPADACARLGVSVDAFLAAA